jgi:hypothetical protein
MIWVRCSWKVEAFSSTVPAAPSAVGVHDQLPRRRRAGDQGAGALGLEAEHVVDAVHRILDVGRHLGLDAIHQSGRRQLVHDDIAVAVDGGGDLLRRGGVRKMIE